jgi:hypothetical protein
MVRVRVLTKSMAKFLFWASARSRVANSIRIRVNFRISFRTRIRDGLGPGLGLGLGQGLGLDL